MGVPKGGGVVGDSEDGPISAAGRQVEALSDAGGTVDEAEVVLVQNLFHQRLHGFGGDGLSVKVHRRGEQEQAGELGMLHSGAG